jgi:hypothetical protein
MIRGTFASVEREAGPGVTDSVPVREFCCEPAKSWAQNARKIIDPASASPALFLTYKKG